MKYTEVDIEGLNPKFWINKQHNTLTPVTKNACNQTKKYIQVLLMSRAVFALLRERQSPLNKKFFPQFIGLLGHEHAAADQVYAASKCTSSNC